MCLGNSEQFVCGVQVKWYTNDEYGPVVLTNKIVVNGDVEKEYRFNRELVERCFSDVDAVERWLRVEMGKQDWWDKASDPDPAPSTRVATAKRPTPTTPTTPVAQSRRRAGTASSTSTGRSRRPPQTPTHHKRGPSSADMNSLASSVEALSFPGASAIHTPSTPTRCPPPSGLFSDPASGLAGGNQMPDAAPPVPAKDGTPALGPALWGPGPTTPPAAAPNPAMFPPTPARSLASARAPSTAPPSSARWVFPSSSPGPCHPPPPTTILTDGTSVAPSTFFSVAPRSYAPSSLPSSPAPRHPPPPTTILTDGTSIAPSTSISSVAPLPSIHSSLPGRFRESFRPPPPPTTILTAGATDVEASPHGHYFGDDDGDGSGRHGVGVGAETWETWEGRVRESFEATRLAWRYVVEVETAAKAIMFGIDGPV